ncbi:hypothetical protein [Synechococcus sp. CBW1108]|uniref:hypothetical protein n=1 Tax=Synechococcus sp. CBW1108 TaxID=1353147 RepID=UPI0018CDB82D|nr:hypothetical protein [Synechococcus sp. CBW1108]QPN70572.1 hypothetical protein H8F27_02575 [Synechococcus sp. CBW1108]
MRNSLNGPLAGFGLVLAGAMTGVMALPMGAALAFERPLAENSTAALFDQLVARGGGGGRAGGGGRLGGAGGGGGGRKAGGHSGFSNSGPGLNRGSTKPAGGWSTRAQMGGRPSLNRPAASTRPAAANRQAAGSRPGGSIGSGDRMATRDKPATRDLKRDGNRSISRDVNRNVNRDVNRNVNRDINRNWSRNVNRVNTYPGWARPGWGVARPWNHGWYGGWSTPPSWGWWSARAATWGIASLTTAAIINNAVSNAIDAHNDYIVVANTNFELLYGTVQPTSSDSVSFVIKVDGSEYQLNANCKRGTINGQDPNSAAEAELLNAACQVAYGSA